MKLVHFYKCDKHEDIRGSLISLKGEVIRKNMRHLFVSYTKPNLALNRGNHYHKYKNEWFYVIKGIAKLNLKDMKTEQEEIYNISDNFGQFVHIKPGVLHTINNIGKTELILLAVVDRKFMKGKPDTYEVK